MGQAIPGYASVESVTPREILYQMESNDSLFKPGGIVLSSAGVDGGNTNTYDLRAGWAMGQITASKKWVPCKRTQVNGTSGAVTAIVVDNSYPFVAGDTITIGTDTGVAVSAVNYGTHTLTIASTTVADNDVVFAEDGSGVCRGFLYDFARLRNQENTAAADRIGKLLIAGKVDKAMLLGDIDAIIATLSTHFLGGIQIWSSGVRVA